MVSETTPDDPEEVVDWLRSWLEEQSHLDSAKAEILRDIVRRPSAHQEEIAHFAGYDGTPSDIGAILDQASPDAWGYPAQSWDDVRRIQELRDTALSHAEAVVQMWREKGYSHDEIAARTTLSASAVDTHAHRIHVKYENAQALIEGVTLPHSEE